MMSSGDSTLEFTYYYKITIEEEQSQNQLLALINSYVHESLRQFNADTKMSLIYSTQYFFRETINKGVYNLECDIIDFTPEKIALEAYLYSEEQAKIIVKWFGAYEHIKNDQ
ncbi:hypothetical protein [Emticicia sp. 17c]|uniref:hypothetical protein n=1 Tax=Emticicia sp. 17c TaxID=3127704 RepID=UPI00301D3B2B